MSSDESGGAKGCSQESYCMVSPDDIPTGVDRLAQIQVEQAILCGPDLQDEDDDLNWRLERLKAPLDGTCSIDFENDEYPTYCEQPPPQSWRPLPAARLSGGAVGARGFDITLENIAKDESNDPACVSANSADIRLHQFVGKPLAREAAASLNLLVDGTSASIEDQSSDKKHSNPEIPRERPKITPRGIRPGWPPNSNERSSDDDEVVTSPLSTRSSSPTPMLSSEDEEVELTQSDEEAYEFLHQIGFSLATVSVPLKIVKQAMQMHELEGILNTYFLIGYEEGYRKNDLGNHIGPEAANAFYRKLGVNMISDPVGRTTNQNTKVVQRLNTSDEINKRFKELGFVDDEVVNDQVGTKDNDPSTSPEVGGNVSFGDKTDRRNSTVFGQTTEFQELTDVKVPQRELETAFGVLGKPIERQESKKVVENSTTDWVRKSNQIDDNDDDTLTDDSGEKGSRTSRLDMADKPNQARGGHTTKERSTILIEKSAQTTPPKGRTCEDSFDDIRGCNSTEIVRTPEQGVQINLWRGLRSAKKTGTSEQSSQTIQRIVDPTEASNSLDLLEEPKLTKTICLEALVQEQLKTLKKVAEERDDLLRYLEAKEENWNKLGRRYQKEINTLRGFATQIISDKLASGRSVNRRTHTSLVRAKQNQDKMLALCFEQRNKISELQLQLSYQMRVTFGMTEELDAARTALNIEKGKVKINKTPELHKSNIKGSVLYQVLTCDRAGYPPGTTDEPEMAVLDTFAVGGHLGISVEKLEQEEGDGLTVHECLSVPTMKDYIRNNQHNREKNLEELTKIVEKMIRDRGALWML